LEVRVFAGLVHFSFAARSFRPARSNAGKSGVYAVRVALKAPLERNMALNEFIFSGAVQSFFSSFSLKTYRPRPFVPSPYWMQCCGQRLMHAIHCVQCFLTHTGLPFCIEIAKIGQMF